MPVVSPVIYNLPFLYLRVFVLFLGVSERSTTAWQGLQGVPPAGPDQGGQTEQGHSAASSEHRARTEERTGETGEGASTQTYGKHHIDNLEKNSYEYMLTCF